ncbi:ARID DNA-binding domain-containing protein [Tanacetum coccineum]
MTSQSSLKDRQQGRNRRTSSPYNLKRENDQAQELSKSEKPARYERCLGLQPDIIDSYARYLLKGCEVLIKDGNNGYLIPGVHYAPEITLNILSINLLKQQGFEIIFEGNRCTLEYMFKNQHGQNLDVDKMRQRHNDYLDDYFESLDKERIHRKGEVPRFVDDTNASEVHTFQEFVAFLNLIKNDDVINKGWDTYRNRFDKVLKWFYNHYLKRPLPGTIPPIIHGVPIHLFDLYKLIDCMGGYLSVQFGQEFGALAEILGLTRSDGEEIRKCYINYLDVFISYYKTARAPQDPTRGEEDPECLLQNKKYDVHIQKHKQEGEISRLISIEQHQLDDLIQKHEETLQVF